MKPQFALFVFAVAASTAFAAPTGGFFSALSDVGTALKNLGGATASSLHSGYKGVRSWAVASKPATAAGQADNVASVSKARTLEALDLQTVAKPSNQKAVELGIKPANPPKGQPAPNAPAQAPQPQAAAAAGQADNAANAPNTLAQTENAANAPGQGSKPSKKKYTALQAAGIGAASGVGGVVVGGLIGAASQPSPGGFAASEGASSVLDTSSEIGQLQANVGGAAFPKASA